MSQLKSILKNYPWKMFIVAMAVASLFYYLFDVGLSVKERPLLANYFAQKFAAKILPEEGVVLPVMWGDLGAQLVKNGVIDVDKMRQLYATRGGLGQEAEVLLSGTQNGKLAITKENANFLLNLFWALGLGNKNEILEKGPMSDPRYGGAEKFASTGGWTLAQGNTMSHFSHHQFFKLTPEQQALVARMSLNIYRPCCGNPTFFPDCNHGMAMLGLLELMASQGVSETDMYKAALAVNSYWFPDNYLTIAKYLQQKGFSWDKNDPKDILGPNFSSAQGYNQIKSMMTQPEGHQHQGGASCGV